MRNSIAGSKTNHKNYFLEHAFKQSMTEKRKVLNALLQQHFILLRVLVSITDLTSPVITTKS